MEKVDKVLVEVKQVDKNEGEEEMEKVNKKQEEETEEERIRKKDEDRRKFYYEYLGISLDSYLWE